MNLHRSGLEQEAKKWPAGQWDWTAIWPFAACVLMALLFRIPFFFTSTDGYLRDAAMTYHDEAIFMQAGAHILGGHLPYIEKWDVLLPAGWFSWAVIMLLTGGNLVAVRVLAALLVGVVGYICYRVLADFGWRKQGLLSAVLYIVFASGLQASQSFSYEQVLALPLACLLYMMLHPKEGDQRYYVLGMVAGGAWLHHGFLWFVPLVAVLYRPIYRSAPFVPFWLEILISFGTLLAVVAGGYVLGFLVYLYHGEQDLYLRSLIDAQQVLFGWHMDKVEFFKRYMQKVLFHHVWLLGWVAMAFIFAYLRRLLWPRLTRGGLKRADHVVFLFVLSSAAMLYAHGNHDALFMFYTISILPVLAVAGGMVARYDFGQLRLFIMLVVVFGLYQALTPVGLQMYELSKFTPDKPESSSGFMNDRLYRTARLMGGVKNTSEMMAVCGEDDILYPLTGMENPRYFIFPFYAYNQTLQDTLGRSKVMLAERFAKNRPLYIVGRTEDPLTDRCFAEMKDIIQRYFTQIANIDTTIVLIRKAELEPYVLKSSPEYIEKK